MVSTSSSAITGVVTDSTEISSPRAMTSSVMGTPEGSKMRSLVAMARSLREQIDFESLRRRTEDSPYARAFFTLVEALGIAAPAPARAQPGSRAQPGPHIRVVGREEAS